MNNQTLQQQLRANADIDEMEGCTASVVAMERAAADKIDDLEAALALFKSSVNFDLLSRARLIIDQSQKLSRMSNVILAKDLFGVNLGEAYKICEKANIDGDSNVIVGQLS